MLSLIFDFTIVTNDSAAGQFLSTICVRCCLKIMKKLHEIITEILRILKMLSDLTCHR